MHAILQAEGSRRHDPVASPDISMNFATTAGANPSLDDTLVSDRIGSDDEYDAAVPGEDKRGVGCDQACWVARRAGCGW